MLTFGLLQHQHHFFHLWHALNGLFPFSRMSILMLLLWMMHGPHALLADVGISLPTDLQARFAPNWLNTTKKVAGHLAQTQTYTTFAFDLGISN